MISEGATELQGTSEPTLFDFRTWSGIFRGILLALLFLPGTECIARNTTTTTALNPIVPFRLLGGYGIVIPVYVNGSGPYNFFLDTGTTVTMVDQSLASRISIRSAGPGAVASLVKKIPVSIGIVSSLNFGPVTTNALEVLIRDLKGLQARDNSIVGVLGQNALENVDFLLDYSRKRITFDTDESVIRLIVGVRHPLISIPLPDGSNYSNQAICIGLNEPSSCNSLMLLDSGSASVILFRNAQPLGMPSRSGYVQDTAGARQVTAIYQVHLCLQDLCRTLDAQATSFTGDDVRVQGLLPTVLFTKLYISNRHRFVIPEPGVSSQKRSVIGLRETLGS